MSNVIRRGELKVLVPKIRLIALDGKSEKQYVFLPDDVMTKWDRDIITVYINTRLTK